MHLFLFILILVVVSAVNALIKPVPLARTVRDGLVMFFTTALGMGAVAFIIHLASL